MYHGNSRIIRRSTLDEDIRLRLLEGLNKPAQMHYFNRESPTNETDEAVLEFLDREQFNCSKTHIEYWYQEYKSSGDLWPHVDFNEKLRHRIEAGEKLQPEELMSPITISCYLEAIDLELNRVGKTNLKRIVSMLTRLIQRTDSVSEGSIEYEYRDAEYEYGKNARTKNWTEVLGRRALTW